MVKPFESLSVCMVVHQNIRKPNPRVINQSIALKNLGATIFWVSPMIRGEKCNTIKLPTEKRIFVKTYPNIRFITYGLPINFPFIIGIIALSAKSKIYHVHDMRMLGVALFLKLLGKKVIYEIGDDNASLVTSKLKNVIMKKITEFILRSIESFSLRFFDYVITLTDWLKLDKVAFTKKISTLYYYPFIYYPSNISPYQQPCNRKENLLIYIGQIAFSKGLEEMVTTVRVIKKHIHTLKILLIGPIEYNERLFLSKVFQEDHNLTSTILIHPEVSHWEIQKYLTQAKIGLNFLKPLCRSYLIALPLKVLDMMACGLPVISFSGMKEVERIAYDSKAVLLVDSNNLEEIVNTIENLLLDENSRYLLINNAKKYTQKNFTREKFETEILNIYSESIKADC